MGTDKTDVCGQDHSNVCPYSAESSEDRSDAPCYVTSQPACVYRGGEMLGVAEMTSSDDKLWDELTPASYTALRSTGMSDTEINRYFGLSSNAVYSMKRRYNIDARSPRQKALESYVYGTLPTAHGHAYQGRLLRDHVVFIATGKLPRSRRKELFKFYDMLRRNEWVVEYNSKGGWSYRPREKRDGTLLIRVNEFLVRPLTEEDMVIYAFPPSEMLT